MDSTATTHHIVMLPFMAHGHLIPFLALARQIQRRTGFTITIASTPFNIKHLQSTIHNSSILRFSELPFCSSDHNLPPDAENTEVLPLNQIIKLVQASAALEQPFSRLVSEISQQEKKPLLCIISDVFLGWATEVASNFGTINITFTTSGAFGTAAYISLWQNLPHRFSKSEEFSLPGFPDNCLFYKSQLHQYLKAADGTDIWSRTNQPQIALSLKSSGWLCNTVEEIEPLGLDVLRRYTKLPVWSVGPLLPQSFSRHSGKVPGIAPDRCVKWLDSHSQGSVLYISFGSQNTISTTQMRELAMGLEESFVSFIWVIRGPFGYEVNGDFEAEWLPEGFEERITARKQGLLVHKWAPQLEILAHRSTGAFLSHCGWNSVVESLSKGVPIIGWPLAAEQAYNSKMLMDYMGVCVELTRGVDSELKRKEVKRVVELVMEKKGKGEEMKKKAEGIAEEMRKAVEEGRENKGSSIEAIDDFVGFISSKAKRQFG